MLPKKIHYCWFGKNPLPKSAKKCINSWRKFCPNYEIIEWNEDNFDLSNAPLYVKQAYDAKKWAFVSDYVRLYALTKYGGIYMDTDVELIKPFVRLMEDKAFVGFERDTYIGTAVMACEKDFPLFVEFFNYYNNATFLNGDGTYNTKTNVTILTDICSKHGMFPENINQVVEGLKIYKSEYFSPKSFIDGIIRKTENTIAIHHFDASWYTKEEKNNQLVRWRDKQKKAKKRIRRAKLKKLLTKILGEKLLNRIRRISD